MRVIQILHDPDNNRAFAEILASMGMELLTDSERVADGIRVKAREALVKKMLANERPAVPLEHFPFGVPGI